MINFSILRAFTPEPPGSKVMVDFVDVKRWLEDTLSITLPMDLFTDCYGVETAVLAELLVSFSNKGRASQFKLAWHGAAEQVLRHRPDYDRVLQKLEQNYFPGITRSNVSRIWDRTVRIGPPEY